MTIDAEELPSSIEILSEQFALTVDPAHGGVIRRFAMHDNGAVTNLLRPSPPDSTDPLDSGCFPLVPFSNRIALGRFEWGGRTIRLPANIEGGHAIHGQGWQSAWKVGQLTETSVTIRHDHAPGAWPFAYRAEIQYTLNQDGLTASISVENRGSETKPAGLGFHPYFLRPTTGGLLTNVNGVWFNGVDMLPTDHADIEAPNDLLDGWLPKGTDFLDHCFTGWSGHAEITVPGTNKTLRLTASDNLDKFVVYAPPDADFFCAEPVSNINNAVNRRGSTETGLVDLAAGAVMQAWMRLQIVD
ncbi:MAG: aldose 1-epimerase [Pseudomonadota bacterium]